MVVMKANKMKILEKIPPIEVFLKITGSLSGFICLLTKKSISLMQDLKLFK